MAINHATILHHQQLVEIMKPSADTQRSRKENITTFLTHLICISILFILPEMLNSYGRHRPVPASVQTMMYAKSLVFIAVFYINYYLIINRCFRSKRFEIKVVVYNLMVVAGAMGVIWLMWRWSQPIIRGGKPDYDPGLMQTIIRTSKFMIRDLVMVVLTIGLAVALKLSDRWTTIESRSREIMAARKEEELENLKQQLNPHFLFNTLNSIYALISISPDTAQAAVHKLSQMLRYVLYEDNPTVDLSREFDFVRNYVALMKLRLSSAMTLRVNIDEGNMGKTPIAPLLFITLVENAFKHGNTGKSGDTIAITLEAADGTVDCTITNPLSADNSRQEDKEGGIGLANLRRRLDLLYPGRYTLAVKTDDDTYTSHLSIALG